MNDTHAWKVLRELSFVGKTTIDTENGEITVECRNGQVFKSKSHSQYLDNMLEDFLDKFKQNFIYSAATTPLSENRLKVEEEYRVVGTVDKKKIDTKAVFVGTEDNFFIFNGEDGIFKIAEIGECVDENRVYRYVER